MKEIVYIFFGGGIGSVLRYLAQISVNEKMSSVGFPFSWGTFIVNTISERWNLSMETRLFLTVGLCGGFTTFSTFSNDGLSLLKGEFYGTFLLYTLLSIIGGLLAVFVGGYTGKLIG